MQTEEAPTTEKEHRLRCGDTVRHVPTGQDWRVSFADYDSGYMSWYGWPEGEARISECELTHACSDAEHEKSVAEWLDGRTILGDYRRRKIAHLYRPSALLPEARAGVEQARRNLVDQEHNLAILEARCASAAPT